MYVYITGPNEFHIEKENMSFTYCHTKPFSNKINLF